MNDIDWNKMNPITMWRDWVIKSEGQWSEAVCEDDEGRVRAAAMMNRQIDEARMMHRMFAEMAQASLAAANLPSRNDFEALDERMGRIEDGLAGSARRSLQLRKARSPQACPRPTPVGNRTRDRRPPRRKSADEGARCQGVEAKRIARWRGARALPNPMQQRCCSAWGCPTTDFADVAGPLGRHAERDDPLPRHAEAASLFGRRPRACTAYRC